MDHLAILASEAEDRIADGYYKDVPTVSRPRRSLRLAVQKCRMKNPVIAELKYASPSHGRIRSVDCPAKLATQMVAGGACALSVLTATGPFQGDIKNLARISGLIQLPVLMKDIIVSPVQLQAGAKAGADGAVLIAELFTNGLSEYSIPQMLDEARRLGLEILAEAGSIKEFSRLTDYRPELYGVNNRDLSSLKVSLETTEKVLSTVNKPEGPVVAESGIESASDVRRLRAAGADAFLVGTSIMEEENIRQKVQELVNA